MITNQPIDLLASSDLGKSNKDNLTSDDTPTIAGFAGVALFGATVDFTSSLDGVLGSTTVGADGIWQITLPQLSQGNNVITAIITAPDTSVTTETITLVIDTYAVITIDQPIANNGAIEGPFTLTGTTDGVENSQTVTVTLTDSNNYAFIQQVNVTNGTWSVNILSRHIESLAIGRLSVEASVIDKAGNVAQDFIAADGSVEITKINLLSSSDTGSSNVDDLTYDDTPTIEGYAGLDRVGLTVELTSDLDGFLGTTTVGADGIWQITLPQLSQGNNWITASITEPDSNIITKSIRLGIDTYAVISINEPIANNGVIDGDFTLSGTVSGVEEGRLVTITLTDNASGTLELTATASAGVWSVDVDVSLAEFKALALGSITVDVSVSDRAGNVAHDAIAADGSLVNSLFEFGFSLSDESNSGRKSDFLTNDTTPTFESNSASLTSDMVITFSSDIDGSLAGQAVADGSGGWLFTAPELSDGLHTITITGTTPEGYAATNTTTVEIDSFAEITINQPIDNDGVVEGNFSVTGTTSGVEDGQRVVVVITDTNDYVITRNAYVNAGVWDVTITNKLAIGPLSITATVTDKQDNVAQEIIAADGSVEVIQFSLLPTSDSGASSADRLTNDNTPTIEGYFSLAKAGATVDVNSSIDGFLGSTVADAAGYWQMTLPQLSDGDHSITATVTGLDSSTFTSTLNIVIDTFAEISIDQPLANNGAVEGAFALTGTTTDTAGLVTVVITDSNNNQVTKTDTYFSTGIWSVNISEQDVEGLALGPLSIKASIVDKAGNTAEDLITSDGSVGKTGINLLDSSDTGSSNKDDLTNDNTPTLEGYVGMGLVGLTVELSSDLDGVLGSTTIGSNGLWQITLPELSEGVNNITATITAPDSSVITEAIELTIDTYAMITIDEPVINNNNWVIDDFTLTGTVAGVEDGNLIVISFMNDDAVVFTKSVYVSGEVWSVDVSGHGIYGAQFGSGKEVTSIVASVTDEAGNNPSDTISDLSLTSAVDVVTLANGEHVVLLKIPTGYSVQHYNSPESPIGSPVELDSHSNNYMITAINDGVGYVVFSGNQSGAWYDDYHAFYRFVEGRVWTFDDEATLLNSETFQSNNHDFFVEVNIYDVIPYSEFIQPSESGGFLISQTGSTNETSESFPYYGGSVLGHSIYFTDEYSEQSPYTSTTLFDANGQLVGQYDLGAVQALEATALPDGSIFNVSLDFEYNATYYGDSRSDVTSYSYYNYVGHIFGPEGELFTEFDFSLNDLLTTNIFGQTLPTTDLTDFILVADYNGFTMTFNSGDVISHNFSDIFAPQGIRLADESNSGSIFDVVTNDLTPTLEGASVTAGSVVTFSSSIDGALAGQAVADANGRWSFTTPTLSLGDNWITATITAPNSTVTTESIKVVVDTYADVFIGQVIRGEGGEFTVTGTTAGITSGNLITVTLTDKNDISVSVDTRIMHGTWSVDLFDELQTLDLSDVTIDVSAMDVAANSATAQVTMVLDALLGTPTVNTIDTSNTRPWLSGSFDATHTDTLTVTVDGKTYTLGEDSNLFQHANNANIWVLKPQGFYHLGEHDVQVTASNNSGLSVVDSTTSELTISRDMFAPRVDGTRQIYNNRPAVGGWFDEAATKNLTVELNGTLYTLGVDAELYSNGPNHWVLNLSSLTSPLPDAVYDVVVTTTDANGVTLQDLSSGELTIGMLAPTVTERETTNFKPVLTGFYDSDFANGLSVTVNGTTYTLGVDSELSIHANNNDVWKLQLSQALAFGDNDIQVTATDTLGRDKADITTDEIHIYQTKSQAVNGDVLITQAGNDIITINDNSFTQINAGLGTDTLLLDGDAINLDFANIQGIDVVDLNDAAATANTLTLTLNDVLTATDNSSLSVLGDGADTVNLASADNWAAQGTQIINGTTFDAYDSGSASLLIEQGITVQVV